jgi:hypothetical protein
MTTRTYQLQRLLFWSALLNACLLIALIGRMYTSYRTEQAHEEELSKVYASILANQSVIRDIGASIDSIDHAREIIRLVDPPSADSLRRLFTERYRAATGQRGSDPLPRGD